MLVDSISASKAMLLIGGSVCKHSKRPFKSGKKVNTVKGVVINPYTGNTGFSFKEDDSIVDIRLCKELV